MTDVQELRITLTVDDFDAAVRFYRDALGLPEIADWSSDRGPRRRHTLGRPQRPRRRPGRPAADAVHSGPGVTGASRIMKLSGWGSGVKPKRA